MLKVYDYCLDTVFIIDTEKNEMYMAYPHELMWQEINERKKRITKAIVNKHIKDRGYVISHAVLENYAPEERSNTSQMYIGEFADTAALSDFVKSLWEKREQHSVDFDVIWRIIIALNQGKTEQDYNRYGRKKEDEMKLFRLLKAERSI